MERRTGKLALPCLLILSCLIGCTTQLNAVRVKSNADPIPAAGAPYNLTFTQYEVTITRRVAACERKRDDGTEEKALVMATDAKAVSKEQRDPKRTYVIDLQSLQSRGKTSDLVVEYHPNGALKTINATAEDRSAQILTSTVVTLGKLVAATAGFGKTSGATAVCSKETVDTLKKIETSEGEITKKRARVEKLTYELDGMTKIATTAAQTWGKEERARFANKFRDLQSANDELKAEQEKLAELLKTVSVIDTFTWPKDGTTFVSDPNKSLVKDIPAKRIREWASVGSEDILQKQTRIFVMLESEIPISDKDPCGPACRDEGTLGLKYRMPVPGRLLICTAPTCDSENDEIAAKVEGSVSQLGRVFTLPLRSAMFGGRKSIVAEFNDAGQPVKLGAKTEIAGGEVAATSFGAMADAFISARKAVVPSELDRIKAETEMLTAKKGLQDAKDALEPPANEELTLATQAFAADTALKQAKLANMQADAALEAAEKAASNTP